MAEFKFSCPQCKQNIQCDTGYSGTQINCPACQQAVVVPQAPRSAAAPPTPPAFSTRQGAADPAGGRRFSNAPAARPPVPAKSRATRNILVIAGSAVVLAGLVTAVWLGYSKFKRGHLPSGLVALWSGDSDGKDSLGRNNGTLVNVTLTDGPAGQAFHLNGTNAYVQIPDSADLKPKNITVAAWVKFDAQESPNANLPGQQNIVFKLNTRDPHQGNFTGYNLFKNVDHFAFCIGSAGGDQVTANSRTVPQVGVWYHLAGTYDRTSGQLKIYVNGAQEGGVRAKFPLNCGTRPLFIGTTGEWWDGKLQGDVDGVAIFNRALSAGEIQSIYKAGGAGKG